MDKFIQPAYNFNIENPGCIPDIAGSERIHRETGVNPVRSRHCDRESVQKMPLAAWLGRPAGMTIWSQENCLRWISVSYGR